MVNLFQANSLYSEGFDKSTGNLLYHIATRYKGPEGRINLLVNYVCAKKLTTEPQATGMLHHYFIRCNEFYHCL